MRLFAAAIVLFPLCDSVQYTDTFVPLDHSEKILVCGEPAKPAWKNIPPAQARYFMKIYLQKRGYHKPRFEIKKNKLLVTAGNKTTITKITSVGAPDYIRIRKKRKIVGAPLNPKNLDAISGWTREQFQFHGHGCPEVKTIANRDTGEIFLDLDPGRSHILHRWKEPPLQYLHPEVLHRFEAFEFEKTLDLRLLNLTSRRILDANLFLSAYYDLKCDSQKNLNISQHLIATKPRMLSLGVGVDTESLLSARARFLDSRIGMNANSFEATLFGSFKEQSGEVLMRLYPFHPASRFHLIPRIAARRKSVEHYENIEADASIMPATTYDNQVFHLEVKAGPEFSFVDTRSGIGPHRSKFVSFLTSLQLTSHLFEYYAGNPQSGWQIRFQSQSRIKDWLSNLHAHRLQWNFENLWNIGAYDPPLFIFGWRALIGSVWIPRESLTRDLPSSMKFYLGGENNIRGFQFEDLPNVNGFLTAFYQGFEFRAGDIFPYHLQPFLFFDVAMGGYEFFKLEKDVYYAPGVGMRIASPIGVFRGSLARGYMHRREAATQPRDPHWEYFLSYGQEF